MNNQIEEIKKELLQFCTHDCIVESLHYKIILEGITKEEIVKILDKHIDKNIKSINQMLAIGGLHSLINTPENISKIELYNLASKTLQDENKILKGFESAFIELKKYLFKTEINEFNNLWNVEKNPTRKSHIETAIKELEQKYNLGGE